MRTSTGVSPRAPSARTSPSCSTRRSFTWKASVVSPISSRKSVPPWAATKWPGRARLAPVNAPRIVTEELALEQRLGKRGAVDRHERAARAPAARVHRACDQLLARARLTEQEHRRVGALRLAHEVETRAHARALRDDSVHRLRGPRGLARSRELVDARAQARVRRGVAHDDLVHAAGEELRRAFDLGGVDDRDHRQPVPAPPQPARVGERGLDLAAVETDRAKAAVTERGSGHLAIRDDRTRLALDRDVRARAVGKNQDPLVHD